MADRPDQPDDLIGLEGPDTELLELYLDGQLSGERAAHAEARIAERPALQAVVQQQARIDDALKRNFQPPAVSDDFLAQLLADPAETQQPAVVAPADPLRQRRRRLFSVLAVAASLVLCTGIGLQIWRSLLPPAGGYGIRHVAQIYDDAVRSGFEPDWLCEDDQEFAQTFADRQGQGLLLDTLPKEVRMAGLAYLDGFTLQATSMFAYVGDQPVLVLVARTPLVPAAAIEPSPERDVSIFTREIGGLTIVEVSPLDEPRVMDSLRIAEVPETPTGHVPGTPTPQP